MNIVEIITLGASALATLGLIWACIVGGIALFGIAWGQGTIGYIIYFVCWVCLFPAMILVCTLFGLYTLFRMKLPPSNRAF